MRPLFAVCTAILFFSSQTFAATLSEKQKLSLKSKVTLEQCATLKISDTEAVSPEIIAQCTVYFEGFANILIEGIGSSPLANCRLISDGTARLKTNPYVKIEKWGVIAIHTESPLLAKDSNLKHLMFPWSDSYKECPDWRAAAAAVLVINPIHPKQQ